MKIAIRQIIPYPRKLQPSGTCAGAAYTMVRKLGEAGEKGPVIVLFFSVFPYITFCPIYNPFSSCIGTPAFVPEIHVSGHENHSDFIFSLYNLASLVNHIGGYFPLHFYYI